MEKCESAQYVLLSETWILLHAHKKRLIVFRVMAKWGIVGGHVDLVSF